MITDVLAFWRAAGRMRWFGKDPAFDADIRRRFMPLYWQGATGRLGAWAASAEGALALVILLDQFPRNMFRDSPLAFGSDRAARNLADLSVARGYHQRVDPVLGRFFFLPFEHSEDRSDQERSVALFAASGADAYTMEYVARHREIIARFGRFPHRNRVLGRPSTQAEIVFLREPNSRF